MKKRAFLKLVGFVSLLLVSWTLSLAYVLDGWLGHFWILWVMALAILGIPAAFVLSRYWNAELPEQSVMADSASARFHKNAPGDFYTTGECRACGLPEEFAPECMAPLENGNCDTYFLRQPATPEEIDHVCEAVHSCCAVALRYGGRDEAILRRLGKEYCDVQVGVT